MGHSKRAKYVNRPLVSSGGDAEEGKGTSHTTEATVTQGCEESARI